MKRLFDIFISLLGILILFPLLIIIALLIKITSKGKIFFLHERIGRNLKPFKILKFRTMYSGDHSAQPITAYKDKRITPIGKLLRKTKLDELPQLFNILTGKMSFVGPRPESTKYLNSIQEKDRIIFTVKPGLTDFASIVYSNEENFFKGKSNVEEYYLKVILPKKIKLCLKYVREQSMIVDIGIIFKTIKKVLINR